MITLCKNFKSIMSKITRGMSQEAYEGFIHIDVDNILLQSNLTVIFILKGVSYGRSIERFAENFLTFPNSYKNQFIEEAKKLFGVNETTAKIEVWPSNKIRYAYLGSNYYERAGHIGSSCMRHKENQKALNFYVKNNVKIVVLVTKDNKIKARALLWENVSVVGIKKTYTYLDRVYYSREAQKQLFINFAKENKFITERREFYIKDINLEDIIHLPYTDTFKYLYYKDKVLSKIYISSEDIIKFPEKNIELTHVGNQGYFPQLDKNSIQECFTLSWVSKKDCIKVKQYKGYILKRNIVNINGAYYSVYDDKHITSLTGEDNYCLKKNVVTEVLTDNQIDKTKAELIGKYGGYVQKDNVVYIDRVLYSKYDNGIIRWKNKYYLKIKCCHDTITDTYIPKFMATQVYKLEVVKDFSDDVASGINVLTAPQYGFGFNYTAGTKRLKDIPEFVGPYYVDIDKYTYIELNTGEYILTDGLNYNEFIIKRNKKYYLRHLHEFMDKNQLVFTFMK